MIKICSFAFALALVASGTVLGAENQAQQDQASAWKPASLLVDLGNSTYPIQPIASLKEFQTVVHSVLDQTQFFQTLEAMTEESISKALFLYGKVFLNIGMDGVRQSLTTYTFGSLTKTITKLSDDGQWIYLSHPKIDLQSPFSGVRVLVPVSPEDYRACCEEENLLNRLLWTQKETAGTWKTSLAELKRSLAEEAEK